jgi:hypothetical protein
VAKRIWTRNRFEPKSFHTRPAKNQIAGIVPQLARQPLDFDRIKSIQLDRLDLGTKDELWQNRRTGELDLVSEHDDTSIRQPIEAAM